ncbi:NADP-dependent isocitrate dehydrogenase [Gammaproteobacteria bacterium]|nr:NADP-dependent isocitrate dehydrogenase [Gammaproteobacteria bacterium]
MSDKQKIIYTDTDEAPRLATYSLLPIIKLFTEAAGVSVEMRDISLAGRIISAFPEKLDQNQRIEDELAALGDLTHDPSANIIKLPNISASNPQIHAAIKELQIKGYDLPDYPEEPANADEEEVKRRYDRVKGSAVNPVLREGNSDRRAAKAVKDYAKKFPHSMGTWSKTSRSKVSHMDHGDFYGSEQSCISDKKDELRIVLRSESGEEVLNSGILVDEREIVDAAVMSKEALCAFLDDQVNSTEQGVLFSLHLKATMMKVSDPIIFGHGVRAFYKKAFEEHSDVFESLGVDPNNGIGDAYEKIEQLDSDQAKQVREALDACMAQGPDMAMVNSDRGITNLHVPSDVIIDASMPAAIRESGKMWGPDGELHDMNAVIPDRCYAGVYDETIKHCIENGAFDPSTMGSVPNVGLMAQKAEEYGSHDTTFEMRSTGTISVESSSGQTLLTHVVEEGDIWRLCRVKDEAVKDWVKLAVNRGKATGWPLVFWLDESRAHDANLIDQAKLYLSQLETNQLDIQFLAPAQATKYSLERMRLGKNTISVTGNVLRDYLTDLFPILELGTSAKMLSIVPLINGGGLFETGAGGSAPKHVQQFEEEGHLRWDSLGEFLALGASLEHLAQVFDNDKAQLLADTLNGAVAMFLDMNKSPSRKVNEIDNRGSHFYLALYWSEEMSKQTVDPALSKRFGELAAQLKENEEVICEELLLAQGSPVDVGGYFSPDLKLAEAAMRPSKTLNSIISGD